jgi:Coenzyme PQQ synthesis protein D (PqqD)
MVSARSHFPSVVDRDGAVVLDIEHDEIVTLNSTGGYVWERLQKQNSLEEIVRDLANETGADIAVVDADVHAFVEQLRAKGLQRR